MSKRTLGSTAALLLCTAGLASVPVSPATCRRCRTEMPFEVQLGG